MRHARTRCWTVVPVMVTAVTVAALATVMSLSCTDTNEFETVLTAANKDRERLLQAKSADLLILFSGATRGNFEPCGCGGNYEGGFSRRATVVNEYRKLNRDTVLVDTGDLTSMTSKSSLEYISQAYQQLKYDAILLGWSDLRNGLDKVEPVAKKYDLPLVLSNLKSTQPTRVREVISFTRGRRKIAVIGVIGKHYWSRLGKRIRKNLTFEDPVNAVQRLAGKLGPRHDAIILLSYLSPEDRQVVRNKLTDVDVWIDSGTQRYRRPTKGKKTEAATKNITLDSTPPLLISWRNDRRIGLACFRFDRSGPRATHAEMFALRREIKQVKKFLEIYDAYKFAARQAAIARRTFGPAKGRQPAFTYAPADKCQYCHQEQYVWWSKTKHARAFDSLVEATRDDDPNCWLCHTTGPGEPTGFVAPEITPKFLHVGCQMCHRIDPTRHPDNDDPRLRKRSDLTRQYYCKRCHVPNRSPKYNHKSYLKRVACPKAARPATAATQPAAK